MPAEVTAEYAEQVQTLLAEADTLPEGQTKAALCEQAIAIADAHRDEELGYEARMHSMFPLYHSGRTDALLVHFAWCLAMLDRDPDLDPTSMLWRYRWVIDCLPGFPEVPLIPATPHVLIGRCRVAHPTAWPGRLALACCRLRRRRLVEAMKRRSIAPAGHANAQVPRRSSA